MYKQIRTYLDIVNDLTLLLRTELNNKFIKILVDDIDTDSYDMYIHIILNIPKEEYPAISDKCRDIISEYDLNNRLVILTQTVLEEDFKKKKHNYIEDRYLRRGIFEYEEDMLDFVCDLQKEKCFRDKIRELYNTFGIPINRISQTYNISEDCVNSILFNNDQDLTDKVWWKDM